MTAEQENAIKKIDEEFEKHHGETNYQFMSDAIIDCISKNPDMAAPVLDKNKTMAKAWQQVFDYAKSVKTGNFAYVPPEKAKQIVFEYFGISEKPASIKKPQPLPVAKAENVAKAEPQAKKLNLDLDDLLGGL